MPGLLIVGLLVLRGNEGGIVALTPFGATFPAPGKSSLHHHMTMAAPPRWMLLRHRNWDGCKDLVQKCWISRMVFAQN